MFFEACLNSTIYSSINILSTTEHIPREKARNLLFCVFAFISNKIFSLAPSPPQMKQSWFYTFSLFYQYLAWKWVPERMAVAGLICCPHFTEDKTILNTYFHSFAFAEHFYCSSCRHLPNSLLLQWQPLRNNFLYRKNLCWQRHLVNFSSSSFAQRKRAREGKAGRTGKHTGKGNSTKSGVRFRLSCIYWQLQMLERRWFSLVCAPTSFQSTVSWNNKPNCKLRYL